MTNDKRHMTFCNFEKIHAHVVRFSVSRMRDFLKLLIVYNLNILYEIWLFLIDYSQCFRWLSLKVIIILWYYIPKKQVKKRQKVSLTMILRTFGEKCQSREISELISFIMISSGCVVVVDCSLDGPSLSTGRPYGLSLHTTKHAKLI